MNSVVQLYYKSFVSLSRTIWLLSMVTLINRTGAMVLPFTKGETGMIVTMLMLGPLVGASLGVT